MPARAAGARVPAHSGPTSADRAEGRLSPMELEAAATDGQGASASSSEVHRPSEVPDVAGTGGQPREVPDVPGQGDAPREVRDAGTDVPDELFDEPRTDPPQVRELAAARRARTVKTKTAVGVEADAEGADWSDFSVGRALRLLHSANLMVVRRTLRKLHIRMWHAPAARLKEILVAAGASARAVDLIQTVCDTCPACRAWHQPGRRPIATSRVVNDFNQEVQFDLLFWKTHTVMHLMCALVRFSVVTITPAKDTTTVLTAISHYWLRV